MVVIASPRNRRRQMQNGDAGVVPNGIAHGIPNGMDHSNGHAPICNGNVPEEEEVQDRVENVEGSNHGYRDRSRSWVLGVVPLPNWEWLYEPEFMIHESRKKGPR